MAKNNTPDAPRAASGLDPETRSQMPLLRINFIVMAIAIAMIILGFALMAGPASTMQEYNPDIFSTRRIVVGPTIAFLGFVGVAIALIIKPKDQAPDAEDTTNAK